MFASEIEEAARDVIDRARRAGVRLATAESCTGGLVAAALTDIAGASDVFDCGFITYSNAAKIARLGVDAHTLARWGAVSEAVACAMAQGAASIAGADLAVAVTGVAGPGGGTPEKPVGLVHFALAGPLEVLARREERFGDLGRTAVRLASVRTALALFREALGNG